MKDDEFPSRLRWRPTEERLRLLLARFAVESPAVYVVGGAVRDAVLDVIRTDVIHADVIHAAAMNQPARVDTLEHTSQQASSRISTDLDIALPKSACQIARRVADHLGWAFYKLDAERDIARLVYTESAPPLVCDVARFQGDTLAADLAGRDFSINAMAFKVAHESDWVTLIDRHNGHRDLEQKQIRQISPQNLISDPVRLLRAVRFAAQFDFEIEAETRRQIQEQAASIVHSSQERIRDELWKALATSRPAEVLDELNDLGLLPWILPEVAKLIDVPQSWPHHLDVYQHTLSAVRHAGFLRDWLLRDNEETHTRFVSVPPPPELGMPPELVEGRGGLRQAQPTGSEWLAGFEPSGLMLTMLQKWQPQLQAHFQTEIAAGHCRGDWLVWLALFHDVGKPATRTEELGDDGERKQRFFEHEYIGAQLAIERLTLLHFSRDEVKLASKAITGHMRPHHLHTSFPNGSISRRACYRFFRDVGQIQSDSLVGIDVALLALADMQAIYQYLNEPFAEAAAPPEEIADWKSYLDHIAQLMAYGFDEDGIPAISQPRLVDGHQLMEQLGMKPGPEMGQLLEQIAEAQAAGEIETEEEALNWAACRLSKLSV